MKLRDEFHSKFDSNQLRDASKHYSTLSFVEKESFAIIDCSRQNEFIKSATMDVRIEFDCKENANTI